MRKGIVDSVDLESMCDEEDYSYSSDSNNGDDYATDELSGDEDDGALTDGRDQRGDSFVLQNSLRGARSVSYSTKWLDGTGDCYFSKGTI